jgi:hypothetical protein
MRNLIDNQALVLVGALVALVLTVGGGVYLVAQIYEPVLVQVEVELKNECNVPDSIFAAQVVPNGRKIPFSSTTGRALLEAYSNQQIKLTANTARFKDFRYEGASKRVSERLVLVANCDDTRDFSQVSR